MASRTQTLVQLTDELRDLLDRRAARLGVSRSSLIRDLLERGLTEERGEALSMRIAEGYARAPQSEGRDAWGDLDAWSEANAGRNFAALAEEEESS